MGGVVREMLTHDVFAVPLQSHCSIPKTQLPTSDTPEKRSC